MSKRLDAVAAAIHEHYVKPMRIEFGLMAQRRMTLRVTDPSLAG